jgi:cleavage and polyadenylation specificity factor subunit 3
MVEFLPLGGAGEIGANCYYINISGTGILLDCGMHPKKTGAEALPDLDLIKDLSVDFVLISHAHQDHIGALPFVVQCYPHVRIITTPQTRALAELTLHDSVSILKEQMRENDRLRIYSHEEIDLLIKSVGYKSYNEEFFLTGYNHKSACPVKIIFYDAGHILGSAGILIEHESEKIFYTGDINLDDQALLSGAKPPECKINTLITEATYGATDSDLILSWKDEAIRFAGTANRILNNGGSILIPVFAVGKTQEMLATIGDLMLKRKLVQADIYTGGIGTKINRVYDYNRYVVNMQNPDFELRLIQQNNLYEVKRTDYLFKQPSIVLASSGMMLEKTMSYKLAQKWLGQKQAAIFTVGYMEESTPGFKIANSKSGDKIELGYGKIFNAECTIEKFRFPAHSKREGLLEIAKKLNPENVILVHGDQPAIDWLGASVLRLSKNIKVFQAVKGKTIHL